MNLKLNRDNVPTLEYDHSECLNKLWTFYKDGGFGVRERSEIEQRIQLLTLRIYSSMKQQTRIVRIDTLTQEPVMLRYTQLKGRAEVLQPDSIGFLGHFEELKKHLDHTPLLSHIDMLSISKICMETFEQSPRNPYGGEIMIELAVHADHESLFDACAITSMVIAYALECTPDVGHLLSSLDVLEYYDSDVFGHPLS
jgi:hypothetical protein